MPLLPKSARASRPIKKINHRGCCALKAIFIGAEPQIAEFAGLSLGVRWPGAKPLVAKTAAAGLERVYQDSPDLVLIHPSFSDMPLSDAIQELRRFSNVPLLVLNHQGSETELITALESGADDYVRLPCDPAEMMARIWALLRRSGSNQAPEEESPQSSGQLLFNHTAYVTWPVERQPVMSSTGCRFGFLHKTHDLEHAHGGAGKSLDTGC